MTRRKHPKNRQERLDVEKKLQDAEALKAKRAARVRKKQIKEFAQLKETLDAIRQEV